MSNSTKTILVFLVVILIVAENPTVTETAINTTPSQPATPADAVSARDNSNTSLSADLNSIDAQLQTVDTNSASVDQSLNDKAVAQTE